MPYTVSQEVYNQCHFVIYLICLPIITIGGLIGNSYSLYILRAHPTKQAFCTYLKALTCSDTLLLACAFLRSLFRAFEEAGFPWAHEVNIYVTFGAGILIGSALQRLSSSLISVIALERLFVVVRPLKVRTMILETHARTITAALACFYILIQLPTFGLIKVDVLNMPFTNESIYAIQRTQFAKDSPKIAQAYLFTLAILGIALPLVIVVSSTATILFRVKMKLKDLSCRRVAGGSTSIETERMTLTLVGMAGFFTLLSVPAVIIYVWSAFDRSHETLYLRYLFTDLDILLVCLNSAIDFIVYVWASKKFRAMFLQHFCGFGRRKLNHTSTNSSYNRTSDLEHDRISTLSSMNSVVTVPGTPPPPSSPRRVTTTVHNSSRLDLCLPTSPGVPF